ncbi:Two component system histidine kinase [Desulfonema limicola]|uniref:histidine kinase n=1 Tax=Desulfonema limicola TaxID=45656 RepID=A0A975B7X0_9BACT|nr:ATP-binding protein [Desulfonema limicola]QTA80536.1 Two component system histidine kinase [Desulfonema limicola]
MKNNQPSEPDNDFNNKLKWLMFFRVLFTSLLLGSTIVLQFGENFFPLSEPLLVLYELIIALFLLSFIYSIILPRIKRVVFFAYIQVSIDTLMVTLIIFLTGSFASLFSFLYLVVIIYASMLLFKKGSMIMAALCSIQYGILVDMEFYGVIKPFGIEESLTALNIEWSYVLYKIMIIMIACFAVAFLSGFLAEQARKTRKELRAMEAHVKRVERMAAVGEMAAGLAHEIKNPLASLRGSIQILIEDIICDPGNEKLMNIILREADRLNSLVSNFLLFAKPPPAKPEIIDLENALTEIVTILEKDRLCRDITITRDIEPGIWVEMDSGHLRQVIWNLLINAAESITGRGFIDIGVKSLKDQYVIITIKDNGCGIPQDVIPSIFDPFITTKPDGTGLGLSIVHRIIESYESRLDVESSVDRGTLFTIKLKKSIISPNNEKK